MAPVNGSGRRLAFRPALAQTLGFVVLLPALLGLALWQVQRAGEKAAAIAALSRAGGQPPRPIADLIGSWRAGGPQRVRALGRFAAERVLLDNRVSNGRAGYELLAPLVLADGGADGRALLVDLGWLPGGADRRVLPRAQVPEGPQDLTGLALAPSRPIRALTDREALAEGWPLVAQTLEPARLAARLGRPLLPAVLYPDGSAAARSAVAALTGFPPQRHWAYAVQWLAIALVLCLLYLSHGLGRARALAGEDAR